MNLKALWTVLPLLIIGLAAGVLWKVGDDAPAAAVWVPARDPRQLPVCQACKETYDMYRIFNDGLRDSPND